MSWYLIVREYRTKPPLTPLYKFVKYECDFHHLLFALKTPIGFYKSSYIFDDKRPAFVFYVKKDFHPPKYVSGAVACIWEHHWEDILSVFDPKNLAEYRFQLGRGEMKIYLKPRYEVLSRGRGFYSTRLRDIYNGEELLRVIRILGGEYSKKTLEK